MDTIVRVWTSRPAAKKPAAKAPTSGAPPAAEPKAAEPSLEDKKEVAPTSTSKAHGDPCSGGE